MNLVLVIALLIVAGSAGRAVLLAQPTPSNVVVRSGDASVTLHWDAVKDPAVSGYRIYRSTSADGEYVSLTPTTVGFLSFADLTPANGTSYFYRIKSVTSSGESSASSPVSTTPNPFENDARFLDYLQATAFDYFWYEANPATGLVRDRSTRTSPCSIAAVGFGLTAIGIGIDRGWIKRDAGRARTLTTLKTFWEKPQGPEASGRIGHKGWFYHFIDMNTGSRVWNSELSSIDTALLLAGVVYAREFFSGTHADEVEIRRLADALVNRVDWNWMRNNSASLTMGWKPESGFISSRWLGYNEAMILYVLGFGAETNALPAEGWQAWTSRYQWRTNYNQAFVHFEPLFGHQYSHCWIDFRHIADAYMAGKGITYHENSRRATLAQRSYAIANPGRKIGYSSNVWGLTACDGPGFDPYLGYSARGAPPPFNDDGTIAPTAAGGSLAFAPEICIPALREMYSRYRTNIWTGYGFRDAFNLAAKWWGRDVLGIDQGPILIMAENLRTRKVWELMMRNPQIQRGLERAGFKPVSFASPNLRRGVDANTFTVGWHGIAGRNYQVEHSPDLFYWLMPANGFLSTGSADADLTWVDTAAPTVFEPANVLRRFYRVFEISSQ